MDLVSNWYKHGRRPQSSYNAPDAKRRHRQSELLSYDSRVRWLKTLRLLLCSGSSFKSILDIFHRSVDVHHHEFEKKRENELGLLPVL